MPSKRSKRINSHPKLQVDDPRAACDTQDWQVQTYPDKKNAVDRREQGVMPAATAKKPQKESTEVEVTPDLKPMLPLTRLPEGEDDWMLVDDHPTPRFVPTEMQWLAVDPPSYLEVVCQGDKPGAFFLPKSPKSLNDREVGPGRMKMVTFQLEDPAETTAMTADEKDLRWEDGLERRKGIKKEKGQRAERLARDAKKEKGSSSSNHRKA
jgi:hypothetical protein